VLFASHAVAACREDAVELRGDFGAARFSVDVADEPGERAQGLMHVEQMATSRGMLFIYESPQHATFWMKNTLIPLDMIFLDAAGIVTRVHENAVPLDETTIDGGTGVIAVLEINGGLAGQIGIDAGDELRHPGLDQARAAWACE
jgi:uncharacterized membrane protein (UPF0127 family)